MRCPNCGSLDTQRYGTTGSAPRGLKGPLRPLQRFFCRGCSKSFTLGRRAAGTRARFSDDVIFEAVRLYVQGLSSYRTLATLMERRLGVPVSRITLNDWVAEVGGAAKTPLEVSVELAPPAWGGFLGADGKAIFVGGEEHCLLVGVDQATHDVVHALVCESEDEESFERLVREAVTVAGYPLKGLVSDAAPPFVAGWENYFALLPFQLCRIHASRRLDFDVAKAKRSPDAPVRAELKDRVRAVLFAPSEKTARRRLDSLIADWGRYEGLGRVDVLSALEAKFDLYMTHHRVEGLPADANITENVVKQLGKKPRLMEGFSTLESAERYSRLLVGCYRFKRFTDSCRPDDNGSSPLEIAGVDPLPNDWLRYLVTPPPAPTLNLTLPKHQLPRRPGRRRVFRVGLAGSPTRFAASDRRCARRSRRAGAGDCSDRRCARRRSPGACHNRHPRVPTSGDCRSQRWMRGRGRRMPSDGALRIAVPRPSLGGLVSSPEA